MEGTPRVRPGGSFMKHAARSTVVWTSLTGSTRSFSTRMVTLREMATDTRCARPMGRKYSSINQAEACGWNNHFDTLCRSGFDWDGAAYLLAVSIGIMREE